MTELFNDKNQMELPETTDCGPEITKEQVVAAMNGIKSRKVLKL